MFLIGVYNHKPVSLFRNKVGDVVSYVTQSHDEHGVAHYSDILPNLDRVEKIQVIDIPNVDLKIRSLAIYHATKMWS